MQRLKEFGISLLAVLALAGIASAQKWEAVKNVPNIGGRCNGAAHRRPGHHA